MMRQSIETVTTPNPNSIKLALGRKVFERRENFLTPQEASGHPLAARLFALEGVRGIFLCNDFITVTRDPATDWQVLLPEAIAVITAYLS